jgi:hypothetical protein
MYFGDYAVWIETVKVFLFDCFNCGFVYVMLKIIIMKDFPHGENQYTSLSPAIYTSAAEACSLK